MTEIPTVEKLRWQCRRGMLELDLVFEAFLDNQFEQLDIEDKKRFAELLTYSDQDLQQWIMNKSSPADSNLLRIIDKLT